MPTAISQTGKRRRIFGPANSAAAVSAAIRRRPCMKTATAKKM
jgi:hypothetical protein